MLRLHILSSVKHLKNIKTIEDWKALDPEENQEPESTEGLFPKKKMRSIEIKNEIDEIKTREEKIKWKSLRYKTNKYAYDFQQFETIRSSGSSIYMEKINIDETEMDQSNLLKI